MSPHFDPTNYCIDYDAVLDNKEARRIFHEYLNDNRDDEPLIFLDYFDEYSHMYEHVLKDVFGGWADHQQISFKNSSPSKHSRTIFRNEVIGRAEMIINTFLEYYSEKELNIGTSQTIVLNYWKELYEELIIHYLYLTGASSTSSYCTTHKHCIYSIEQLESAIMKRVHPETLFSKVLTSVHLDLKMDQFPRFVHSVKLLDFLRIKGETFTRSIGYDTSKAYYVDLRFKPKDFKEQVITDNHIYFGFTLAEDTPDWKLIYGKKDLCCYSSNSTYFFGESKGLKLLKAIMYLPFSLEDFLTMISNTHPHNSFDSQTKDGFVLQSYRPPSRLISDDCSDSPSTYATQCLSISIDLSLPFIKKRQLSAVATTIKENDMFFHVLHTADFSEEEMPTRGRVKADSLSYYLFYRIADKLTRVVHVTYSSFLLPFQTDLILELFWKKRAKSLFKGFNKTLGNVTNRTTNKSTNLDHHKHIQAIIDNKKAFPERSWYNEWLELNQK